MKCEICGSRRVGQVFAQGRMMYKCKKCGRLLGEVDPDEVK